MTASGMGQWDCALVVDELVSLHDLLVTLPGKHVALPEKVHDRKVGLIEREGSEGCLHPVSQVPGESPYF